jgi:hypothetical protein
MNEQASVRADFYAGRARLLSRTENPHDIRLRDFCWATGHAVEKEKGSRCDSP